MSGVDDVKSKVFEVGPCAIESLVVDVGWVGRQDCPPPEEFEHMSG